MEIGKRLWRRTVPLALLFLALYSVRCLSICGSSLLIVTSIADGEPSQNSADADVGAFGAFGTGFVLGGKESRCIGSAKVGILHHFQGIKEVRQESQHYIVLVF
jgi:hypothetical protein